ncbi:MAG: fatty acid--CoA ligase [Halomonadaceae bacterium]|nr:MAG: fatty acid--CoA ligase [Halomonadaceae bacterium]
MELPAMPVKLLKPAPSAYEFPLLIKHLLLSAPRYAPDQQILYGLDKGYTYTDLIRRIHQLANVLTEAGVKAGDTVAVLDWDSTRYLECFFAIPMIGAVLHTVNVRLSPEQILYTMNHAEDDLVLVHDDFAPLMEQVNDQLTTVKGFIQLTDNDTAVACKLSGPGEYEALVSAASAEFDFPDFDEQAIATTFYTTGTTGNPKGVFFSHRQLVLHTLGEASTMSFFNQMPLMRSDTVYMPITPMFHVHAWGVPFAATMMGIKQVYPGRYDPATLLKLLDREKVTFSHCVPTILQMILDSEESKAVDLSNWHVLIGGSALTEGLARKAMERGIKVYTGYGMSETCPLLSLTHLRDDQADMPLEQQVTERCRTGVAIPLVDVQIHDANGQPLPQDGEAMGEVVARAPWLTQSYFKEPEKGADLWQGGWLHTGDVASIGKDSKLQIRDRIKDVIKTGGEWISSLDLENLISQHPDVAMAVVVGMPDEQWGERPHAVLMANEGKTPDLALIKTHLQKFVDSGDIEKWAIPDTVTLIAEIPRTSVGKVDKKKIRADLAQ